jgi:hypothetical protein
VTPTRKLDSPEYVDALIARLRKLAAESDPSAGKTTEQGKDSRAFDALHISGELVSALAGWAICHTIGLAQQDLASVPSQPTQTKKHPEYLAVRELVDKHDHEVAGSMPDDPRLIRKAVINLLRANSGGWPHDLVVQLMEALKALDYGETSPILQRIKEGRKAGLTELHLQLKAICLVEYLYNGGMKKFKAQKMIAEAYGVGLETIRIWEKRLPDSNALGQLNVARAIAFARNSATHGKSLLYSHAVLVEAGHKYRSLLKRQKTE